ncbi:hypothetical protein STAS_23553 [Striga asiatica]|uniref:DUF1985 domain-containing protein n=1 Tax=Striga asiatica TaxID=4170 RepID=A0A5A7QNC4_STRAF|nr:hypothetical protein STAS_23553 [Striga asiatica]
MVRGKQVKSKNVAISDSDFQLEEEEEEPYSSDVGADISNDDSDMGSDIPKFDVKNVSVDEIFRRKNRLNTKQKESPIILLKISRKPCSANSWAYLTCKFQTQLVNLILLREVHQRKSDEVWVNFGGKMLRFGIEEFALISGMPCIVSSEKLTFPTVTSGLYDTYFSSTYNPKRNPSSAQSAEDTYERRQRKDVGEDVPRMLRLDELRRKQTEMANDLQALKKLFQDFFVAVLKRLDQLGGNLVAPSHDQFVSDGPNNDKGGAPDIDVDAGHPQSKTDEAFNQNAMKGKTDEAVNQNAMNGTSHDVTMNQSDGGYGLSLNKRIGLISELIIVSQPSFDAITKDLPPTQPSRDVNHTSEKRKIPVQTTNNGPNDVLGVAIPAKPVKPPVLNRVLATSYKRNVIKNSSPFNVPFWKNIFEVDTLDFMRWLRMGSLRTYRKIREHEFEHYLKRFRELKPPFDFNVARITDKNWFKSLHMDVLFYYLRKLRPYGSNDVVRYTITEVLFDQKIKALFDLYVSRGSDTGRLSIGERRLVVYNSCRSEEFDNIVYDGVRCYSTLIPIFLGMVHFYSKRTDINNVGEAFDGKGMNDLLDVIMAENLPQQEQGDCGIFVASFAVYFITKFDLPTDYLPDTERMRYSYQLYQHGRMKQKYSCESDDDSPRMLDEIQRAKLAYVCLVECILVLLV